MNQYCVGVDIGGTSVKCGIFNINGLLMEKWEVPTRKAEGGKNILPDTAASLKKHLADRGLQDDDIAGIGIGVPGPVEPGGYVHVCVNLGWGASYPAQEMQKLMGGRIRCEVGNDANVAALGEMWQGSGKGSSSMLMVTLGTGVGGGLIQDGHIVTGVHGAGAEIGHFHVMDGEKETCNCGGHGCLEQYASATGIRRVALRHLAAADEGSSLRVFGDRLSAKDVCDAAKAGDAVAASAFAESMRYLGLVLSYVSMTTDPEVFVIGGGVSKAGQYVVDTVQKFYEFYTPLLDRKAKIVLAKLGNDAGIYGSAWLSIMNG